MNKTIARSVAEATRVAVQIMAEAEASMLHIRTQDKWSHHEAADI